MEFVLFCCTIYDWVMRSWMMFLKSLGLGAGGNFHVTWSEPTTTANCNARGINPIPIAGFKTGSRTNCFSCIFGSKTFACDGSLQLFLLASALILACVPRLTARSSVRIFDTNCTLTSQTLRYCYNDVARTVFGYELYLTAGTNDTWCSSQHGETNMLSNLWLRNCACIAAWYIRFILWL
jgi:hypothetical protein